MIIDLHTGGESYAVFSPTYRVTAEALVMLFSRVPSLCLHESLCVNPSVAHTTKQWSPKQSADMSPGLPAPRPLAPMGVYIPPYTPSLQTIQWNTATHSSPVWVGQTIVKNTAQFPNLWTRCSEGLKRNISNNNRESYLVGVKLFYFLYCK